MMRNMMISSNNDSNYYHNLYRHDHTDTNNDDEIE